MALLEVENLKLYYPIHSHKLLGNQEFIRAVDGVSFHISKGETVGLVGESGCGKSSLGRAIMRLETPQAGVVKIADQDVSQLKGRALRQFRQHFQMIFQDPYGSLNPRLSIFTALEEVLLTHTNLSPAERRIEAENLLQMVGLESGVLDRYPHQFSGGQRQRIGIARALAAKPDLIVADEPVSALDVSVQAQIINLLQDIQQKTGTALLFIAHDLAVVEHISDRILVMYLGKIVESGPAQEVCQKPLHPYTKALLSAVPRVGGSSTQRVILKGDVPSPLHPPKGCAFHPRCPLATEKCRLSTPELSADAHTSACFFS